MPDFKTNVGYLVVISTIFYCMVITAMLLWGCTFSEVVKDLILIILTWFVSKAGTIIDYLYGSSKGSNDKNTLLAQAPPPEKHCCRGETPTTPPSGSVG